MKCQKMKKYLYIGLSAFMVLYFCLCSCIGSYASTTDSGNSYVPIQQQWADNVYNNFQTVLQDSLKVSVPKSEADRIWNDYVDHAYSIWNLEYDDLHQHYGHFRDYVGAQFEMEKNSDNTYNYNMSEDAYTFIQDSYNTYVQSNPLSFTKAYIYSYNYLDPSVFPTYSMYSSTKELCKQNSPKWILLHYYYQSNSLNRIYFIALDTGFDYGLVGTVTGGTFTNVNLYKNWATLGRFDQITNATKKTIMANGSVSDGIVTPTGSYPSLMAIANTSSQPASNTKTMLISSLGNNELVYVFNTLNAYKNYNSGYPQPYYTMSGYTGIIDPMGLNVPNTNGSYESIVNNIQSGWTADEVLALVDRIISNGTGSGNGAGNGGSDSSGLWSRIGDAIGNLIDGIINVLTTVIEHLSDALLSVIHLLTGYTDDNGVVHEGLFGKLLNLVNSGFNNFLASIFSWLPEEIVTLFTAVLVFGIFFGLLKMLRR